MRSGFRLPLLCALLLAGCGEASLSRQFDAAADFAVDQTWADGPMVADGLVDQRSSESPLPDLGGVPDSLAADTAAPPCPAEMVHVAAPPAPLAPYCIDRYEAPNVAGGDALVMYTFVEAEAWCVARQKRLCFDDEWQHACEGPNKTTYPYGNTHQPGVCNDDKLWKTYVQSKLNGWPSTVSSATITTLADLFNAARAASSAGQIAADHVEAIYQGEGAGDNGGCGGHYGVYDLTGNVEEWTRRRDGGTSQFHGNLKGRYWAEARTCQSGVKTHGDGFRFYEIGFRCCVDPS